MRTVGCYGTPGFLNGMWVWHAELPSIGEFIYPWGNGHYTRMSRFNDALSDLMPNLQIYYYSKGEIYRRLRRQVSHPERVGHVMMPTPIDGHMGPDVLRCMYNVMLPASGQPPLTYQIASYLREEGRIYDSHDFNLVVNDGDMGSNVLAKNRNIPSLFITNQFRPRLWGRRFYFYPGLEFVSRQIAKATHILVADSPPPYTLCEYNLNFTSKAAAKVTYVGHFTNPTPPSSDIDTDLQRILSDSEFGYWMRTGNRSTNDGTGRRYEKIFTEPYMKDKRRVVSHARPDPTINSVLGRDGRKYSISDAYDKKVDWLQIDVGFLSETEKETVLDKCSYAVVNGSHTVMGEILGGKGKPVVGLPVYDEHTNNLKWAQRHGLGILANNTRQAISGISRIYDDNASFQESLADFQKNFASRGASNTAQIAVEILEQQR